MTSTISPEEITVLKTHVLIERELFAFIAAQTNRPAEVEKMKIGVRDMCMFLKAMLPEGICGDEWIWKAVDKLSTARNKIAHHISLDDFNQKADIFSNYVEQNTELPALSMGRLYDCCCALYGQIHIIMATIPDYFKDVKDWELPEIT